MSKFEQYEHHGNRVWVKSALKGKHREHCLCWSCEGLKPGLPDNCVIAQGNYEYCVEHGLVLPVWECPQFKPKQ